MMVKRAGAGAYPGSGQAPVALAAEGQKSLATLGTVMITGYALVSQTPDDLLTACRNSWVKLNLLIVVQFPWPKASCLTYSARPRLSGNREMNRIWGLSGPDAKRARFSVSTNAQSAMKMISFKYGQAERSNIW